ncbi:PAS domain S-box protein [bacterium]|nr:PAS domain S-box protein [bacterium]
MRDTLKLDIDQIPLGYCELEVNKDIRTQDYSYKILISNQRFNQLKGFKETDENDNLTCNELASEIFSQRRLKSFYNVAVNNSFMEFELYCYSIKTNLIVKIKALSKNTLSMFVTKIPSKHLSGNIKAQDTNFYKIIESSFDLFIIISKDLELRYCNKNTQELLGIPTDSPTEIDSLQFIHPDDLYLANSIIDDMLRNPSLEGSSKIRIKDNQGNYLLIHFRIKNMLDVDGINGFVIHAKDVTEQEENQKKILENKLYLESLFKAIPNLIFVLDYEGKFLDFKSQNTDKLAFSPQQFIGQKLSAFFPEYLSKKVKSGLKQLKENKSVEPIFYQYNNHIGESGFYECHLSEISDDKVLAIVNDVTQLKLAEETLQNNQKNIQRKLDAIISPEGNLADLEFTDLVNIEEIKDLFQTINDFTDIPISLIDKNGKIIFSLGTSHLCKDFHLVTKFSNQKCFESNQNITNNLKMGESRLSRCGNNIWNFATPIFVGGEQIATLNICQFRLAEDTKNYDEILRHQANIYHFDKDKYLKAYYSLPVIDKERVIKIATYYRDLLSKITALSFAQIKQSRTAHQLKLRDEKLAQITDNMTDVVFTTTLDFRLDYISPSVVKQLGFTPAEYTNLSLKQKFPNESVKAFINYMNSLLHNPETNRSDRETDILELQAFTKQGEVIDVSLHSTFLRDSNGHTIGIIGSVRNITKSKQFESELNNQLQLQSLLSSIAMRYINLPLEKIRESISESLKEFALFAKADRAYIFKYDWDKGSTSNTYEWCREGIKPEIDNLQDIPIEAMAEWNETHKKGEIITIPDVASLSDTDDRKAFLQQQKIKSLISIPLMNHEEYIGFVGFDSVENVHDYQEKDIMILQVFANLLVNISNRIALGEELQKEKERATESDKLKSNLLKNISHEFRTPLNGVIGLSELLQTKPIESEYQKMASMIYSSGIRLNYVLDSIMLLSQLESLSERKFINLEKEDLSSFLTVLTRQYQGQILKKGLEFFLDIQPYIITEINENLFRQALIHIINNAVKYTHKGSIKISCNHSLVTNQVELNIEDTGIGIPKESQELIFSDFRQVSEGYNRAYEGCGLGLPIAKKAIELMNGKIILTSELGKGAKFTIILPLLSENTEESLEHQNKKHADNEGHSIKDKLESKPLILIVEDNRVNQKLATSILKSSYDIDTALDGETAITMVASKQYDAILMDIHLGEGLDGIETTKIIRNDIRYAKTPIIAVTGYTMLGDKENILKHGCSSYLSKPYSKSELLDVLWKALDRDNN